MKLNNDDFRFAIIMSFFGLPLMGLGLWWAVLLAALAAGLIVRPATWIRRLGLGFVCGFLIWFIWSVTAYVDGGQIITHRIGGIMGLHPILLLLVGGILGGLLGGLGGVIGTFQRFWQTKTD